MSAPTIENSDGEVVGGAIAHWVHLDDVYDSNRLTVSMSDYFGDDFDLTDMVVIVGPTLSNDLNFKVVEVNSDDQTILLEVQSFGTIVDPANAHGINLGLLIAKKGAHTLSDGSDMVAGTLEADYNAEFSDVSIDTPNPEEFNFDNVMVFADTQTYNGSHENVIRIREVNSDGFEVRVQELEGLDGVHATEEIGFIAFDKDLDLFTTVEVETTHLTADAEGIEFTNGTHKPLFADMQTANGGDTAMVGLEIVGNLNDAAKVYADEETTRDSETAHIEETIAVAQFNTPTIRSLDVSAPTIENSDNEVIGGVLALWVHNDDIYDGNRLTIDLEDYFGDDFDLEDMVAIVGPTARNDLNFRIVDVDNDDDYLTLEVQDFDDLVEDQGSHGINLGIMVVEQGVHVMSDGTSMSAGTVSTTHAWVDADYII